TSIVYSLSDGLTLHQYSGEIYHMRFQCYDDLEIGVKGIGRVSPIKSKVTDKSDSPRRGWIPDVKGIGCVSPIKSKVTDKSDSPRLTDQVVKESDKVQQPKIKSNVDEKDNPKVKPVVAKEKPAVVKEKPVVVKEKPVGVTSKVSKGNDDVVKVPVVADKDDVVTDKAKEPASIVGSVCDVVKEIAFDVVNEKASDALKNKAIDVKKKSVGKGKKSTVDKPKDYMPNPKDNKSKAHSDVVPVAEKPKPNPKRKENSIVQELSKVSIFRSSNQKVNPDIKSKVVVRVSKSKETPVKRKRIVSKENDRKKKLKGKSKKEDSDSELETDVVDSFEEEVDQKRKKLKFKAGLNRKRSGSDSSDSSSIDTVKVKRLIIKLEKKVKKQENDKVSVPKKELRDLRVNDIARKLVAAKEIDFLFKVNFLTLFTNTMGKADGLKGQICLDVVRRLHEDSVILDIDWCGYIYDYLPDNSTKFDRFPVVRTCLAIRNWSTYLMKQTQELELKYHVLGLLDLHIEWTKAEVQDAKGFIGSSEISEKEALFKRAEEKLAKICSERVLLENLMRKASSDYPGDRKLLELQEKYVKMFRDPISFDVDVDAGNDRNGDDDWDDDNDNDSDGNGDEEDVNEGDKDPNGSNPSFGFRKINLDDFHNDSGPTRIESVDPTEKETIVEGDLFGGNSATLEAMNQEITPEKLPTQKASPSPKKDLFAMQGDKMMIQSKSHEIHSESYVIYSEFHVIHSESHVIHSESHVIHFESHTLAPSLWLDANVIDCWGIVLNHEESFEVLNQNQSTFFQSVVFQNQYLMEPWLLLMLNGKAFLTKLTLSLKATKYGNIRHTEVAIVKQTIPKLKWKTKENFHDCGIFTMVHIETFDGEPVSNLDCGLPVESQLQRDMLRRLRFKFATKILLHEINVHVGKMPKLSKEFDKTYPAEKMVIIVDAFKKSEERDCI
nr:hypothetical protein [Tanacetum cinerariifolium]